MDIRELSHKYSVSEQIVFEDLDLIVQAGFKTLICNRPDAEVPENIHGKAIENEAKKRGLQFHYLPLTHQSMTPENIRMQSDIIAQGAPVLAYCASGTRCTVIWALSQAMNGEDVDLILETTQNAGYPLEGLRGNLETLSMT